MHVQGMEWGSKPCRLVALPVQVVLTHHPGGVAGCKPLPVFPKRGMDWQVGFETLLWMLCCVWWHMIHEMGLHACNCKPFTIDVMSFSVMFATMRLAVTNEKLWLTVRARCGA